MLVTNLVRGLMQRTYFLPTLVEKGILEVSSSVQLPE